MQKSQIKCSANHNTTTITKKLKYGSCFYFQMCNLSKFKSRIETKNNLQNGITPYNHQERFF